MSPPIEQLRTWMAELHDLRAAALVLDWDQHTMMPRRGAEYRAAALSTLERVRHERFTSSRTGELIDAAQQALDGAGPDSDDARLVSVTRRRWEKARRVPTYLAAEMAHASSIGQEVWINARAENDFAAFAPCLERNVEQRVRFHGFRSDVRRLLPGLDLLLSTSLNESAPVSFLEAMDAGVPTVATPTPGTDSSVCTRR